MTSITLGYNPSTGKLQWSTGGKLCEGCCENIGADCTYCTTYSTPASVSINATGWSMSSCYDSIYSQCTFDCGTGETYVEPTVDLAPYINGDHTLYQAASSGVGACRWEKEISLSFSLKHYCKCLHGGCSGTPEYTLNYTAFKLFLERTASTLVFSVKFQPYLPGLWALRSVWTYGSVVGPSCVDVTGGSVVDDTTLSAFPDAHKGLVSGGSWAVSS